MKVIGKKQRSEFVFDRQEAWRRALAVDAQLLPLIPAHPRGVFRMSHSEFNRMDDDRMAAVARRINRS